MGLFLIETATRANARADVDALLERLTPGIRTAEAEIVEARVTADLKRLFVVVERRDDDPAPLRTALDAGGVEIDDVAPVRLVGADLDEVKAAAAGAPKYLVEWDLPDDLTMDTYLARKKAKSPLYADVPEVTFRRTYVREDLDKCLCFYDAPCAEDVYRARDVVSAPVDRFHELS